MKKLKTDVVIIGGGVVGAATAYFLSHHGIDNILVERDAIASHASGFSYAALGTFDEHGMTGSHFEVASNGMRLHRELALSLQNQTGINVEFRERATLSLALNEREFDTFQNPNGFDLLRRTWENEQGFSVKWVTREEARYIEPRITHKVQGGIYTEGPCDVNAQRLTLALVTASELLRTKVIHGDVTGITHENSRVRGVMVEGNIINCDTVLVAMGAWSQTASSWLPSKIKMSPWKGQILRLRLPGAPILCSVSAGGHFVSTKPDGLTWVGPTFEDVGLNEDITLKAKIDIMSSAMKFIPSLSKGRVVMQTACIRPLSADRKLVLGAVPELDGAFIATGGGRLGLMLGPAMGQLSADLIAHGVAGINLDEFDPSRFQ